MNEIATHATPTALEWTGERMVPEATPARTFWEHVYRYRFACQFVNGKDVLDIACGEGYGASAMKRAGARRIIGVDICEEACAHARAKYAIDARHGDGAQIPVGNGDVQVVVSFETIEHIPEPRRFVAECARVLASDGLFIVSTPNRDLSRDAGLMNPFHCAEMDRSEFLEVLSGSFRSVQLFTQGIKAAPWWALRSVATPGAFWHRLRGAYRLRRAVLPESFIDDTATDAKYRADIAGTILARDSLLTTLLNPLAVRPALNSGRERTEYYVAVCRSPIR